LIVDIAENAFAAAFRDYRFPPVTAAEYAQLNMGKRCILFSPFK
jgi:AMMECR1 domain-containing protein